MFVCFFRKRICAALAKAEEQQEAAADNLVKHHRATKQANQRLAECERLSSVYHNST